MPIVGRKQHVDQETGQVVEGKPRQYCILLRCLTCFHLTDWELVFADDEREANPTTFKFLQMAHAWAKQRSGGPGPLSGFTSASVKGPEPGSSTIPNDVEMDDSASDAASSQS